VIVPINKPIGVTSFDVVKKVRKITRIKKVGHGGTLDPFAEGVLIIGIGRKSTRRLDYYNNSNKQYIAELQLGSSTDTLDLTGEIIEKKEIPQLQKSMIENIFSQFIGLQNQLPPMYSAKKINGIRLYKLARMKKTVKRKPNQITITSLELIDYNSNKINFSVSCSKGTYIRQLGLDIANKLGTVGHLTKLNRIKAGPYTLDDCISISAIEKTWMSSQI
tara:strand:+ start:6007 stop:6663 length:657 start_codon:yes stop_codon:yes gene_type:complete